MSSTNRIVPPWLANHALRYRRSIALALALGLAAAGCAALLMFAAGYLISATAQNGAVLFALLVPIALVQVFGIAKPLARYLERLVSHDWVFRVTSDLRLALFRAVAAREGDPARTHAAGEYLGILADDIAHLQNLYLRVALPTAVAYALALGSAIAFGLFSVPFALAMLCAFALCAAGIPLAALALSRKPARAEKAARVEEYAALTDDVLGAADWVLAGRAADVRSAHAAADSALRANGFRKRMAERGAGIALALLMGALACLVVAWATQAFAGLGAQANWIAAFALGFFPLIESFAELPAAFAQITAHEDAVARLEGLVAESEAASDASVREHADADRLEPREGLAIELEDVRYSYPGTGAPALDGASLEVPCGQTVAVLGRSGAGKSTLAQVIRGNLVPDSGTARIAAPSRPGGLSVGYLGQDPYLFNRTLRENLTLGALEADDALLVDLLNSVGLGSKLAALPQGLDTLVGAGGSGFSGGEAHRVAIARVLAADAPVVVVDEPFAALDPDTERELLDALLDACAGRTLVVVTHHLAQIERFDRVVFVEDGRIDLDGSPAELAQASARFRQLLDFDRAGKRGQAAGDGA